MPGQTAVFTGTYTVTQADINHGSVVDHATTQGITPSSGTVNASSNTVTVSVTQSPSLTIAKSANPTTLTGVGETITYTFDGPTRQRQPHWRRRDRPSRSPGGRAHHGPDCQGLSNPIGTCSGSTTALAPGQQAVFTATYVVTQADIDHGSVVDHATTQGQLPQAARSTAHPTR